MSRSYHFLLWPAIGVFFLDQATKLAVASRLYPLEQVVIIPGFFNLVYIHNRGMAFGLMNRSGHPLYLMLLTAASVVVICILILWYLRTKHKTVAHALGCSLVIGGSAGNVMDRIRIGRVIDFLDFYIGKFHWPAFNVADASITLGTCLLVIYLIKTQRSEDVS